MSKIETSKFQDTLGKFYTTKAQEAVSKLNIPAKNPIPMIAIKPVDLKVYGINQGKFDTLNSVLWMLLQTSFNAQKIDYRVDNSRFCVKGGSMTTDNIKQCFKFMKDRLKYTDMTKRKLYKDLTPEMKKEITPA